MKNQEPGARHFNIGGEEMRIDPFAKFTNDPPDHVIDSDPPENAFFEFWKCPLPYNPYNTDQEEDFVFYGHFYDFEKAIFELFYSRVRSIGYIYTHKTFPDCEFQIDKDPCDWIPNVFLEELGILANLLYTVCAFEGENEYGDVYPYPIYIARYLPTAHREEALDLLFEYYMKMVPQKDAENSKFMGKLRLYLLEAAYYYLWNIRVYCGQMPSSMETLFRGFNTPDRYESFIEIWRDLL